LVTGAGGFVGSRVVRALLDEGFAVHGVVRDPRAPRLRELSGARVESCDLTDPGAIAALVARVKPEYCIHCAWIATPGEYLTSPENDVHVVAAEELGKALVAAGCSRLVGLGTCFEYAPSDAPLAESSPVAPSTPYARAKVATMARLKRICEGTTTAFTWARLFYLYGPREDPRRLVPAVTLALLNSCPAQTTGGKQLRDFLHVDDVARALVAVARSEVSGAVNIGSGAAVTVLEVVEAIGRLTGRSDLLEIGALPYASGDPMVVVADTTRLTREVGWQPTLSLEDGLRQTVAWWDRTADA
jgi:nucleoside-diphosphate-sugar epimerase